MKFFSAIVPASCFVLGLASTNLCVAEAQTNYVQQVPTLFKKMKVLVATKLSNDDARTILHNLLEGVKYSKIIEFANMCDHDREIIPNDLSRFKTHYFSQQQIKDLKEGGNVNFKL